MLQLMNKHCVLKTNGAMKLTFQHGGREKVPNTSVGNQSHPRVSSYFTQAKRRRKIDLTLQVPLPQNPKDKIGEHLSCFSSKEIYQFR
jgi:hypothetical protein